MRTEWRRGGTGGVGFASEVTDNKTLTELGFNNGAVLRVMFVFPPDKAGHGEIHATALVPRHSESPAVMDVYSAFKVAANTYPSRPFLGELTRRWSCYAEESMG